MVKQEIRTEHAPLAIGPYSQAIKIGRFIFLSGQIPIDPVTGEVAEGDIVAQTRQVLRNLQSVLNEADSSLKDVVKTTVFLTDMVLFSDMNAEYAEHFSAPFPARATVEVKGLPKGVLIEIDAVAVIGDE